MGSGTNPQGQAAAKNQLTQFLGNLQAQLYTGKDGTANAAMDAYGAGTSALYGTLAIAAGEIGKMPGPIGWTGNAVSLVVGVAAAPGASSPTCAIVGTLASVGGGIAGGAIGSFFGPAGTILGGAGGGIAAQKIATAACQTAFGYVDGNPAAPSATSATTLQQTLSATASSSGVPTAPASSNVSDMAAQIVQFRSSPDYSGTDGAYTVQRGQTLSGIAQANGVSLTELTAANPQISDPNSIRTGQVIRLPDNASGYTPGTTNSSVIPNDAAQTSSLTNVLNQFAGQNVDVVTENSGRIAVLSSSDNTATVINNDGSVAQMSLSSYNQQAQNTYNQMVSNGYINSSDQLSCVNYQDGVYGTTNMNGTAGTVVTNAGMLYQDASGNLLAQSNTGQIYAYDAGSKSSLFAQNNLDGTLSTDIQKSTAIGVDDDLRNYTSQETVRNEQLITSDISAGESDFISGTGAIANLNNAKVVLADGATATINGSTDTISAGANSSVELAAQTVNDIVTMATAGSVVVDNGAQCTVVNASTVSAGNNTGITLEGSSTNVTTGTASTINVASNSNNDSITAGASSTVSVANSDQGTVISAGGANISLGNNTSTTINGANDSITAGTGTSVTADGTGEHLNLGSSSSLTVAGGSATATINNGSVTIDSGSAAVLNGSTDKVTANDNSTVTLAGAGNTLNVNGAGVTATESGSSNTLNIAGTSDNTTATGTGTSVNVNGWKDSTNVCGQNDIVLVTGSGSDNTSVSGTSDTTTVNGNYDVTNVSGWKDSSYIQGTGDSTNVTGSGSDNSWIQGTSDATTVTGNYNITNVNGWQDSSYIQGTGDSTNVAGSGSDNSWIQGTSDATTVSGSYNVTNVNGWQDSSYIQGTGDSTNVTGSGSDNSWIQGTSDATTVSGSYNVTNVNGWKDSSYIQGTGDVTDVTGSGSDNSWIQGTSDATTVSGSYNVTNVNGWKDSSYIQGTGDVTDVTGSGDDDSWIQGLNDSTTVRGNYDELIVSGANDYSAAQGVGDADQITGSGDSFSDYGDDEYDDCPDGVDPIILSLQGNTVQTQALTDSAANFDMLNNGHLAKTGWGTAGEGYLVYDPNDSTNSTVVTQDSQLVAGFGALQLLAQGVDGTSNGWLNDSDRLWADLKVWVDSTGTGQFQQGQLMSLEQLGITGIDLNATTVNQNSNGNIIVSESQYMLANGKTDAIAGVDLAFNANTSAGVANGVSQLIQAMASLSPPSSSSTVITRDLFSAQQTVLVTPH